MEIRVEAYLTENSVLSLKRHSIEKTMKYIVLKYHSESEALCFIPHTASEEGLEVPVSHPELTKLVSDL